MDYDVHSSLSHYFFIIAQGLKQIFSPLNYKWTVVAVLFLVGVLVLLFPSAFVNMAMFDIIRHWAILPVTVYPLVIYFVAQIRGIKGATDAA